MATATGSCSATSCRNCSCGIEPDPDVFAIHAELFGWCTGSLVLVWFLLCAGRLSRNDRLMLAYLLKNSQLPLRTGANVGAGNPSGIPFKKGNPKFQKAIDDAMTQLEQDGTFTKISDKWFGIDVTKPAK